MSDHSESRCAWAGHDPVYVAYHDDEWGVPERDSRALFEKLALDGFQAGLSWITILKKREGFRRAFEGFDPVAVAAMGPQDVARLLEDASIVRSRSKIEATIGNAKAFLEMRARGEDFADFLWAAVEGKTVQNPWISPPPAPVKSEASEELAAALRQRGFKFCGPVIVYAFMQAVGMVNDHAPDCFRYLELGGVRGRGDR